MSDITLLAIDLAKSVFQLHGVNKHNKAVLRKQVKRKDLIKTITNMPPCEIVMEACSGSSYWARQFQAHGNHKVRLISPQHVKPYVKGNKTDRNDSEAIAISAQQERTPSVAVKNIEAQDIQMMHRIRERYVKNRTALANQIRGLLAEYGIVVSKGLAALRKELTDIITDTTNELTACNRPMFNDLYEELLKCEDQVDVYTTKLELVARANENCKKILKLPGIGPITATAIVAHIGDGRAYKNGRHFAASLGLVPREKSSGGHRVLMGITKRGDVGHRSLLIHGGRSVVRLCETKTDKGSVWAKKILERRGFNVASVAVANKNARLIWAIISKQKSYRPEQAWA